METNVIKKECNGKLGDKFNLILEYTISKYDVYYRIDFTLSLDKIDTLDTKFTYLPNQVYSYINVNGKELKQEGMTLDFNSSSKSLELLKCSIDVKTENQSIPMLVDTGLVFNDNKSLYLDNTNITERFALSREIKENTSIELISKEIDNSIELIANYSANASLLEIKINDTPWKKLENNTIKIERTNNKQFIQARIKIDNNYSYSNVIRINSKTL